MTNQTKIIEHVNSHYEEPFRWSQNKAMIENVMTVVIFITGFFPNICHNCKYTCVSLKMQSIAGRKLVRSPHYRRHVKAIVVNEAHLIRDWYVNIVISELLFLQGN